MEAKEIVKKLEASKEFKGWKNENKDSFLAHLFKTEDELQVGYYNKNDTITSFMAGDEISVMPESEIFKKPGAKVMKLELDKMKIDFKKAMDLALMRQKKKYSNEKPLKSITILQKLDEGTVYNITFITASFNTLNFKIDAGNGKILKCVLTPLMEFKAA